MTGSHGQTRTQYYTATSLDGFIADAENSLSWLFEVDQGEGADGDGPVGFVDFFAEVGAFVMGATTYAWMLEHEQLVDWVKSYGTTPAWVFTHRELPAIPGANLTFVSGDVRPVHKAMVAAAEGRNIWVVGGGELAGSFADHGLLDELIVGVAPVTLGAGAPLLPRRLTAAQLTLTSVQQGGQFANLRYTLQR